MTRFILSIVAILLFCMPTFSYAGEDYCEWLNEYVKELQVGNLTIIKGCKEEHCAGVKDEVNGFYIIWTKRLC